MTDVELVLLARGGDRRATETLIGRYRGLVVAIASTFFLPRGERDDLIQEGLVGILNAIDRYRRTSRSPFRAFAALCIRRQCMTAVKIANAGKQAPLNYADSFSRPVGDSDHNTVEDLLGDPTTPLDELISEQERATLFAVLDEELSDLERSAVVGRSIEGRSYEEIAAAHGVHAKAVDNALQRGRMKCKRALEMAA
jgi:RNA polymerase sporulation-specific sigma factor